MTRISIAAMTAVLLGAPRAQDPPAERPDGETSRFIFFAVFEGLVEDGAPDAVVDRILQKNDKGAYRHFVPGCPICLPTINACLAYQLRDRFDEGWKGDPYGAGPGLPEELAKLLKGESIQELRQGIERLVSRYVDRRCELLRLTEAERAGVRSAIEAGRKQGMKLIGQTDMKECPSCDGAFKAVEGE